jgi:hypothetical protein
MKINDSDIKAEIDAVYQEINELRHHVMSLTEVVQGINNVLSELTEQLVIDKQ